MGKVSVVGAGMKSHPGVAAKVFAHARRRGDQHRDDLDLADQDLLRRPRRRASTDAVRALHAGVRARRGRRSRPSTRSGEAARA